MKNGINIIIKLQDMDLTLYNLPPPSGKRVLNTSRGAKYLDIYYLFEYSPQSWREWQRVASIKFQIQKLLNDLKIDFRFSEIDFTKRENELFKIINVEKLYTINELGSYYPEFIKFQKPLYPTYKDEFMKCLTLYAKRLHYEDMLYFESLFAIAIHFSDKLEVGYKHRELAKKSKSILELDRSEWKVKLSDTELKKAYSKGANKTNTKRKELAKQKRDKALKLRESGKTLKEISEILGVSYKTIQRYKLPKI